MGIFENLIIGLQNLIAQPLKSLLTLLGIIIGVFSLVAMIGIGEGTREKVIRDIERLGGSELISIHPKPIKPRDKKGPKYEEDDLTHRDITVICQSTNIVSEIAPIICVDSIFSYKKHQFAGQLLGVSPIYSRIRRWAVDSGRFVIDTDLINNSRVCVLGAEVYKHLCKGIVPNGKQISIDSTPYTVIGTMVKREIEGARWMNNLVLVPITTLEKRLQSVDFLSEILIKAKTTDDVQILEKQLKRILGQIHAYPDKYNVHSQVELIQTVRRSTLLLRLGFGLIAVIILLVSGIGIMNLMLVSVAERTREIGIRKALGAKTTDILIQFMLEAVMMSIIGCFFGIVAGIAGGKWLSHIISVIINSRVDFLIDFKVICFVVVFTAIVGILAGIYPAIRAAQLDPSQALTYE